MNDTVIETIERMERNANAHEDNGEVNTAIQLRHWAEQIRRAYSTRHAEQCSGGSKPEPPEDILHNEREIPT